MKEGVVRWGQVRQRARSRGSCGEGWRPSPRGRNAKMMGTVTDLGRGPGPGVAAGRGRGRPWGWGLGPGPRGRMRTRCSCGEGCVEDTRRCSCTDHWQVRHDHGRVFGRSYTRRQSTRSHMETRCGWFPPQTKASHSPCAPDASCMQHAASSMQHAPCNGHATEMQLPPCTRRQHVGSDASCRIAPFGQRHAKAKPRTNQRTHHGRFGHVRQPSA